MDMNGIITTLFDPATNQITVVDTEEEPSAETAGLDANGIWNQVYDAATNTVRIVLTW